MSAIATAIADVFEATAASQYAREQIIEKSKLISSGILGTSPEIDAASAGAGRTVDIPYDIELPNSDSVASSVATDTDTSIRQQGQPRPTRSR